MIKKNLTPDGKRGLIFIYTREKANTCQVLLHLWGVVAIYDPVY